jgi:hypothetical protein
LFLNFDQKSFSRRICGRLRRIAVASMIERDESRIALRALYAAYIGLRDGRTAAKVPQ